MDYFENYNQQPPTLRKVVDLYADIEQNDGLTAKDCAEFLTLVQRLGYTFDYGLDCSPFNLTKIKTQ